MRAFDAQFDRFAGIGVDFALVEGVRANDEPRIMFEEDVFPRAYLRPLCALLRDPF